MGQNDEIRARPAKCNEAAIKPVAREEKKVSAPLPLPYCAVGWICSYRDNFPGHVFGIMPEARFRHIAGTPHIMPP